VLALHELIWPWNSETVLKMLRALRDEEMKRYVLHNERGLKAFGK